MRLVVERFKVNLLGVSMGGMIGLADFVRFYKKKGDCVAVSVVFSGESFIMKDATVYYACPDGSGTELCSLDKPTVADKLLVFRDDTLNEEGQVARLAHAEVARVYGKKYVVKEHPDERDVAECRVIV